LKSAANIETIF